MKTNLASRRSSSVVLLRRRFVVAALLGALAAGSALSLPTARAQTITSAVPALLSYQGRVTTPAGALVGAGTPVNRTVTFRIWSHATNSLASDLVYSEQQVATISEGEFSVLIGQGTATAGTPLGYSENTKGKPTVTIADAGVFGGAVRYLGVTVDDGNSGTIDPEISPRQQIVTSAFAFRAKYAESLGSNGTSTLTTLDNGRVGIGTASPSATLEVNGTVRASGDATAGGYTFAGPGDTDGGLYSPADGIITIRTNATEKVRVDPFGNVGIGTTAPLTKLDVNGAIAATPAGGHVFGSGDTDTGMFSAGDNLLTFKTGSVERVRLDSNGRLGLGNSSPLYTLDIQSATPEVLVAKSDGTGGALYFGNTGHGLKRNYNGQTNDVGLYTSAGDLYLSANSSTTTSHVVVKNNGNVGLGTTAPGSKLDVVGSIAASGGIGVSGAVGSGYTFRGTGDNDGGLFSPSDGVVTIRTDAVERVRIDGSVLSTSNHFTAAQGLQTTAGVAVHSQGAHLEWNKDNALGRTYLLNQKGGGTGGIILGEVDTANGITTRMEIQSNGYTRFDGRVGIFNSDPQANLHVSGSSTVSSVWNAYVDGTGAHDNTTDPVTNRVLSIISDANVRAAAFDVISDRRIKTIHGVSAGPADLAMLMKIEVTDYTFKDTIAKEHRPQKKVIAQQVEQIFPQAVGTTTDVLPDIFKKSAFKDGWVELATDLKVGERVRLFTDKADAVFEVLEVEPGRFRTSFQPEGAIVFVYGREVKDFRTVDYDAISMLNVSATQQLKRNTDAEVKSLRDENAALRAHLAAQDRRLAELEAKNTTRDAKLAAIEKILSAPSTVMALPAAQSTANGQQ